MDSMRIWTYELQILFVKSENCVFFFVTSSPTAQSNKLFVFNYLQTFSYLYEVSSISLLSRGTLLLYMSNVVTLRNT